MGYTPHIEACLYRMYVCSQIGSFESIIDDAVRDASLYLSLIICNLVACHQPCIASVR